MPRRTFGPTVEKRTLRLLKALLLYVHGELEGCEHLEIEYSWQENGDRPKLIIETKLRTLEALTRQGGEKGSLTTTQISESLHRMEDFLEIIEDNRVQKKGLEEWRFTLTLWSKEINKNLEIFKQEWHQRRPAKSKQLNAESTHTSKTIEKPCGKIRSAVPLIPPDFVERPQIKSKLKKLLLEEVTTSGMLAIGAIQGLGGIGKTTLASSLIQDLEVQRRFPDGILWVTLGQTPDLLPLLSQWVRDLKDHDFKPTTVQMTSTHLRRLLVDKTVLLVVDDVWEEDHLKPFLVGSDNCRVLVTTRRLHVAEAYGAKCYPLDLMSSKQSIKLFENCLNRPIEGEEKEQAQAMAEAVGYLPLALELAVARISRGVTWNKLCDALKEEVARLEQLEEPRNLLKNDLKLMASFNLSLKALWEFNETLYKHFIGLGVLPEDASIAAPMTSTLWQDEKSDVDIYLEFFYSEALLLSDSPVVVGDKEWRAYRLHDLIHDIARKLLTTNSNPRKGIIGLGLTLPEAHSLLLERYLSKTPHQLWHELADDGYIHARLTWHIEKAEKTELLHQLLQEETPEGGNGWYEACERLGKIGNFVEDVGRAWQWAEKMYEQDSTQSMSLQCRYALIFATLNNLASNIPAELLAALVKTGYWQPTQGLAYIQQMQDSSERAQALAKLVPYLPDTLLSVALEVTCSIQSESKRAIALSSLAEQLPPELLPEALEVTRSIQDEYNRARALGSLADKLPELLPEALEVTRSIQDEYNRARALGFLADKLPELLPEALELTRLIQDEHYRAEALSFLADKLPQNLFPEALELTCSIQSESKRARALGSLADKLPEHLLPEALELARLIQDEHYRARALGSLADKLPELLPEALELARSLQNESGRILTLSFVADKLPEHLLPEALELARSIQNKSNRATALSFLVDKLPELLPEALELTRLIQNEYSRVIALASLADKLPEHLLPEALELTRLIQDEDYRAMALSFVADKLPELLPEALELTRLIQNELNRARALSSLAEQLPPELLPEALEVTRSIQDEYNRARALGSLADKLPELLPEALEVTRSIQDEYNRARALGSLADKLPELLPEALELTRLIQDELKRAIALSSLTEQLPPELLPEALEVTRSIQDEYNRARALSSLAEQLPPELLPEALEVTRSIQDEYNRARALGSLADKLPELLPEALELTRLIQNEHYRAEALSFLADKLPQNLFPEALELTCSIQDEYNRAIALSFLANQLPEHLLPEALELTCSIQDEYNRAIALSSLLPKFSLSHWNSEFWQENLRILARHKRQELIKNLAKLSSVIEFLGGLEALRGLTIAMRDICRQWP